jgi:hypothetical protein
MYLFEFSSDETQSEIIAAVDSLHQDLRNGKITQNWSVDQLLNHFKKYGTPNISVRQIDNMIDNGILKSVVRNRAGHEIEFKGLPQVAAPEPPSPESSKKTVSKMAKKALKK